MVRATAILMDVIKFVVGTVVCAFFYALLVMPVANYVIGKLCFIEHGYWFYWCLIAIVQLISRLLIVGRTDWSKV